MCVWMNVQLQPTSAGGKAFSVFAPWASFHCLFCVHVTIYPCRWTVCSIRTEIYVNYSQVHFTFSTTFSEVSHSKAPNSPAVKPWLLRCQRARLVSLDWFFLCGWNTRHLTASARFLKAADKLEWVEQGIVHADDSSRFSLSLIEHRGNEHLRCNIVIFTKERLFILLKIHQKHI